LAASDYDGRGAKMTARLPRGSGVSTSILAVVGIFWLLMAQGARADAIDRYVQAQLKESKIPGVAVAVIHNGHAVRMRGYGLADVERKVPVTPVTVFEIGSITKQFTATAIMMLVEQGKIDLEEPIAKYLPDVPATWKTITIRQLLNHTSGIPDYEEIMGYGGYRNPMTPVQVMAVVAEKPLDFAPGTRWNYSNTGYYLLTLIIEKVSGERYAQFLHEHIFGPAGMVHTRSSEPVDIIPNRAAGYEYKDGRLENRDPMQPTATGGAGMIVSTLGDLAKWDRLLNRKSLLREESYAKMWADAPLADGKLSGYGLGWFVSPVKKHRSARHSGQTAGFTADLWRLPDDHLTVIVLGNMYGGPVEQISGHIARTLIPDLRYRSIPDPNPAIGKSLFEFYSHRLDSEVYAGPLTPDYAAKRKSGWTAGFDYFKSIGPPKSIELVEILHDETGTAYRYRLQYKNVSRLLLVRVDKDLLIDDISVVENE
jgi:CubicO group peptidase (beta-lactamase class C family)